jgi:rRNA-processing protein FCF1
MTNLVDKTKSKRKTFTIPTYIVEELENYSKTNNKKQSQIIALALEEFLNKRKKSNIVNKRLENLDKLVGIAPDGSLKDLDLKDIKVNKALNA